jgi:hypothetical protein
MMPPAELLAAYNARDPKYILFQPEDMSDAQVRFVLQAIDFATRACEECVSTPCDPLSPRRPGSSA